MHTEKLWSFFIKFFPCVWNFVVENSQPCVRSNWIYKMLDARFEIMCCQFTSVVDTILWWFFVHYSCDTWFFVHIILWWSYCQKFWILHLKLYIQLSHNLSEFDFDKNRSTATAQITQFYLSHTLLLKCKFFVFCACCDRAQLKFWVAQLKLLSIKLTKLKSAQIVLCLLLNIIM